MNQQLSPMQQAFEAWVVTQNVVKKYNASLTKSWNNQFYKDYRVNDRWIAWQAAFKLVQNNPCVLVVPNEIRMAKKLLANQVPGEVVLLLSKSLLI